MTTNQFHPDIGRATQWRRGQSGNPGGRPRTKTLTDALRVRLAEVKVDDPTGRTFAAVIADSLVAIACSQGAGAVAAANEIANRLEGRATQRLDVNDITADLAARSDHELQYHLEHGHWPDAEEASEVTGIESTPVEGAALPNP